MTRPALIGLLLGTWLAVPSLRAEEPRAGKPEVTNTLSGEPALALRADEPWLRPVQRQIAALVGELGPAGAWVEDILGRYLRALEAGPGSEPPLPPPAAPEWRDGVSVGPPPSTPSRFMVELSFRF